MRRRPDWLAVSRRYSSRDGDDGVFLCIALSKLCTTTTTSANWLQLQAFIRIDLS